MRTIVLVGVIATALLGIGLSIEHFFDANHYNSGFNDYPITISMHVAPGAIFLGILLFQFTASMRVRFPTVHRVMGRVAVILGLISAFAAMCVILLIPFSGPVMVVFVAPFAIYFGFALTKGYLLARSKHYAEHREWMIRAAAIATGIATQRLILLPMLILFGTELDTIRWVSVFSFTAAFIMHAWVAEVWIRMTREFKSD